MMRFMKSRPANHSSEGEPLKQQPDAASVEAAVVAAAVEEGLVTPHTSAVGVLLQVRLLSETKPSFQTGICKC